MTQEEIIEGNKLIAEFDGYKFVNDDSLAYPNGYYYYPNDGCGNSLKELEEFEYNSSWDWLMPVIEKIEKTGCCASIINNGCNIKTFISGDNGFNLNACDFESKIQTVYAVVVEYIKWYNKKLKQ